MKSERLVLAAVIGVLVVASAMPVAPIREGRALFLLLGLMALRSLCWSEPWRTGVFLVALGILLGWGDMAGVPVLTALFLAGEGIETVKRQRADVLLLALAVLGVVEAFHGVLQWLQLDPTTCVLTPDLLHCATPRRNEVVGFMGDRDTYGAVLALCVPAIIVTTRAWWLRASELLLVAAALITGRAFGPVLALAGGGLVWLWPCRPRVRWAVIAVATTVIFGYLTVVDAPGLERESVWMATARHLPDHPVIGYGLGSFYAAKFHDVATGTIWAQAHNDWLQWAFETGAVGTATLLGYLGVLAWRLARRPSVPVVTALRASLVIAAVLASVHFIGHVAMTAVVLILLLGLTEQLTAKECA